MRSLFTYFFILTSVSAISAQSYTGDSWAQVKTNGRGTITFAYVETPSFVYKDNSGKLTGICVDIMNDFVKYVSETKKVKLGSKFSGDGTTFKGMFDKVKGSIGGVFGLGNITITEERKKEVKFSPPFITNFAILITQNSVGTLASFINRARSGSRVCLSMKPLTAGSARSSASLNVILFSLHGR